MLSERPLESKAAAKTAFTHGALVPSLRHPSASD